jgi:creatinine amidohydrolase
METQWWNLKAPELRGLAKKEAVVIVPVASTEQHGPHLPTQVDCLLVGEIANRTAAQASKHIPTLVTPVVWTGLAEHHMSLGATISLDFDTFLSVLRGVCRSLTRQGFRNILLLNGHGGNIAALTVIVNELAPQLDAPIATATYWLLAQPAFAKILEKQANVRHACEAETSMVLALKPELVDVSQIPNAVGPTSPELADIIGTSAAHRWQSFRSRTSHGAIGDPRAATSEKGEQLLQAAADAVTSLITNPEFWKMPA